MATMEPCYVLATWARPIAQAIRAMVCAKMGMSLPSDRRRLAGEIFTRLEMIHRYMQSIPPYLVEDSMNKLSTKLLGELAEMLNVGNDNIITLLDPAQHCQVRSLTIHLSQSSHQTSTNHSIKECVAAFQKHFDTSIHIINPDRILSFFKNTRSQVRLQSINQNCEKLHSMLNQDDIDHAQDLPADTLYLDQNNHSINLSSGMFQVLQSHLHALERPWSACQSFKHPARLCLSDEHYSNPGFNLLVSPNEDMSFWQDFFVLIQVEGNPETQSVQMSPQDFCDLLRSEPNARITLLLGPSPALSRLSEYQPLTFVPGSGGGVTLAHILANYTLRPRDKINLAYFIVRAYWQFYESDLMQTKWTAQTILFLLEHDFQSSSDEIPLRPYLEFPLVNPKNPIKEADQNDQLTHWYPRILAIGILLLEIGRAEPFPLIKRPNDISQVNGDLILAKGQLRLLKKEKWDGFGKKTYFDDAVRYCLEYKEEQAESTTRPGRPLQKDKRSGILQRRQNFYKHVVKPLGWLAKRGFDSKDGDIAYIYKKSPTTPTMGAGTTVHVDQPALVPQPSFHAGKVAAPTSWLQDLNRISTEVTRLRRANKRAGKMLKPIRVAILDTGFTPFEDYGDITRSSPIVMARDFVQSSNTDDAFGHGTFMANLVIKSAPLAEIIMARVAENTKKLSGSQDNIKDAILWAAGNECRADIISMSFGFPKDHKGMAEAITAVNSTRENAIIFLAAAGNSSSEPESFPARHPSVISIYAANHHGVFEQTNPRARSNGGAVLGTYGSGLPKDVLDTINSRFPNICQPGSSVATAVAAGIAATMLAYVEVLPHLVAESSECTLKLSRETRGMEAMFRCMARRTLGNSSQWFIDPISFWRDTADQHAEKTGGHFSRYCAIHDCLNRLL